MKKLSLIFLLALPWVCSAAGIQVEGVRTWQAPDNTRVVFDVSSANADYKMFRLPNPPRLVIDFKNTRLTGKVIKPAGKDAILKNIRSAARRNNDLRVVLDLHDKSKFKSFFLKPYKQYGHRLVVDLLHGADQQLTKKRAKPGQQKRLSRRSTASTDNKGVAKRKSPAQPKLRDLVIAIDAGHGGEDPGAHGPRGTNEKDVVFAVAKKLAALIEKEKGMRPLMIRDGDYYLSLRQRTKKARDNRADMFISIHADAFRDKRVYGTSVYILSENGATSEAARWLAEKENASDLIGGVSLDDKDNMLARVLLDLSQTATKQASYEAGHEILQELKPLGKLHKKEVQQAAFAVLKSPDIPSVLVETAFISNPNEERKLRSNKHQTVLARALLRGVRDYFTKNAPPGTLYAMKARKHVIARGDTLSEIAQRYHVSIASIRSENKLSGDRVSIGQILRIPAFGDG